MTVRSTSDMGCKPVTGGSLAPDALPNRNYNTEIMGDVLAAVV